MEKCGTHLRSLRGKTRKKKVSYDYENKFLKNWITLGESEARVERKRNKGEKNQEDRSKSSDDENGNDGLKV